VSQPDLLLAELRAARPVAPAEVRERVRLIAAQGAPPSRRVTWRRALAVAVPLAAALAAAVLLLPRSGTEKATRASAHGSLSTIPPTERKASAPLSAAGVGAATPSLAQTGTGTGAVPAPSATRVQRYSASLELRVANAEAISDTTKQAVKIARSLGGYASNVQVDAAGRGGSATLVLRVPKEHVQQAVSRLSALGTIVGEAVSIKDIQSQVDVTARKIARLEKDLASWQAQPQTTETQKHVAALTAQIARLKRGRTATVHTASLATVRLTLTTAVVPTPTPVHHRHGPLHGLAVAFRWAGIGAVYVLALGAPLAILVALVWLTARTLRRRRNDQLLSRS